MFALFKFLFLLVVVFFAFVFVAGYSFIRQLKQGIRNFGADRKPSDGSSTAGRSTRVDGNVVTDRRSSKDANKRIIPDDEGEYVDYEEG